MNNNIKSKYLYRHFKSKYLKLSKNNKLKKAQEINRLSLWAGFWRSVSTILVVLLVIIILYTVRVFIDLGGSFESLIFNKKPTPFFNIKDLLIGISGLIAVFATAWRYKLHEIENLLKAKDAEIKEKDSKINDSKRLDEQFVKALELLKDDNDLIIRQGSIYVLKSLAIKSAQHLQQCLDVLCSQNNWMDECDIDFFIRVIIS